VVEALPCLLLHAKSSPNHQPFPPRSGLADLGQTEHSRASLAAVVVLLDAQLSHLGTQEKKLSARASVLAAVDDIVHAVRNCYEHQIHRNQQLTKAVLTTSRQCLCNSVLIYGLWSR
jgi:cell division protein ZapA (FtsZ GTPase activity inhibitor)